MKILSIIGIIVLAAFAVMAQSPTPTPGAAFATPSTGVWDWITAHLATISTYGGLLLSEVGMRLWPTKNPKSWLLGVSQLLTWIAQGATTIAQALSGILQNTSGS